MQPRQGGVSADKNDLSLENARMSQPRKWFYGLLPIAALLAVAGLTRQAPTEADLVTRGNASLKEAGLDWAQVKLAGRDAVLVGEMPDPNLRSMAVSAADRAFGVRLVKDQLTLLAEAKPFTMTATRDGARVVLTGFAANAAQKAAIAAAAKQAMPEATIVDELKLARGAPASFQAASAFGFAELAKLTTGTLALSDSSLSLTGRAADLPKWNDVRAKLAAMPAGVTLGRGLGDGDILAPVVRPYTVAAEKTATGLTLTGFVPSALMRNTVLAAANALGKPVTDRMQIADGAPAAYANNLSFGLTQLGKLDTGTVSLSDSALTIVGRAGTIPNFSDVKARLAALPQGMTLAREEITAPVVRPYTVAAEKTATGLILTGYVPSELMRSTVLASANAFGKPVTDRMQIADGAPAAYANNLAFGLTQLGKLDTGVMSLSDSAMTITGRAASMPSFTDVRAHLAAMPQGMTLARQDITQPTVQPYLFNATRGENLLTLTGYVPDQAAKTAIADHARRFFEGSRIDDQLQIGVGAPQGFVNAARSGLQDLSRLMPGSSFSMSDQSLALRGLALHDGARDQILAEFRSRLPAGFGSLVEINTAPPPPSISAAPECQILYNDLTSQARILFDTGSAELATESYGLLDRLVVVTRRCDQARVEISGHTDADGSVAMNNDLSRRRAETVAQYLVRAGVGAQRLEAVGYGPSRPVASNDTAEGKAKNRRIEFTVK
jgi:OmpA-OmpF porin, OOP family